MYGALRLLYPPPTHLDTAEIQVLLLCAQRQLDSSQLRKLCVLLDAPFEWETLVEMAVYHKVFPLVYWNLHRHAAEKVPANILHELQQLFYENVMYNMRAQVEAGRALRELQAEGVKVLLFKGPVLASKLYGGGALREYKDFDLLVQPADMPTAREVLARLNYLPMTPKNTVDTAGKNNRHNADDGIFHQSFIQPQYQLELEVHWAFGSALVPDPLDEQNYWDNLKPFATEQLYAYTLPWDDQFLMLCMHGAKHRWHRLKWLGDIVEFCRAFPEFDWDSLLKNAQALRMKRIVLLNLWLAQHLFDVQLPPIIQQHLRQARYIEALGRYCSGWIFAQSDVGIIAQLRLFFYTVLRRESFRDWLPYLTHVVTHERSKEGRIFTLIVASAILCVVTILAIHSGRLRARNFK
jgi:hypothetical protein